MTFNIELNDRIYKDIEFYCKTNNVTIQDYITELIEEKHSMNKYGDLNDIMPKIVEESTVEVKKRGRPKKTTEETIVEDEKELKTEEIVTNKAMPKKKRTLKTL